MTLFLILAALLVAGALLLVVPPMFGFGHQAKEEASRQRQAETALNVLREQLAELEADHAAGRMTETEYLRSREELEKRALEEGVGGEGHLDAGRAPSWAIGLMIVIPFAAGVGYLALGEPEGLDPESVAAAADVGHAISPEQMAGMVAQLAARLEQEPADPTSWLMLVRSYGMMGDIATAAETWRRIGDKVPDDPVVLADWADILAAGQNGTFDGEPDRLIQKALSLDPTNVKAIALAGTSAFRSEDFAGASAYWERILPLLPPDSNGYQSVLASINEAREKAGMPALSAAASPSTASAAPARDGASEALLISGMVSLAPDLAASVKPDEVVFVFVRPAQGGMPVAALRFTAGDLPAAFSFDGVQRMSEGPLPPQIIVAARVSRQGDATARPGDLEGSSAPASPDATDVQVVIDRVRQ